jgi:DNA-binding transcriptional regulator YdaS (Cro superfamily)
MSATELAKKLGVSPATISQSAMCGSQIAKERGLRLNLEL